MDHPEGLWVGRNDVENFWNELATEDKRINVLIPELADMVKSLDAESEAKALVMDEAFPLVLAGGRHMDYNANTIMRDPAWLDGKTRVCVLMMNPMDAASLGLNDGQTVKITTEAGSENIELEITDTARVGHVIMPHGLGLIHAGQKYGANVNRLTKNSNRDPIAGTPLHRFVPCRVEPVS
jgi:anaerobic selenocysteine-containing dehydrogenase